jgi:MFS transporter
MQNRRFIFGFVAFALYFLTGAACIVVGSGLSHFADKFSTDIKTIVILGSLYSLGRVSTVYLTGKLVEKVGPFKVTIMGIFLMGLYLTGMAYTHSFYYALIFAYIGGVGMGAQDTVCPLFLSVAYPDNYAGSLSAGQGLFGLGGFVTPFLTGVMLMNKLPFYFAYYVLLVFAIITLIFVLYEKKAINTILNQKGNITLSEESQIKPLFTKNKVMAFTAILLAAATYSTTVNAIGLYTTTFAEYQGFSSANAVFLLTVYNVGAVIGSLIFILILKRISAVNILIVNNILSIIIFAILEYIKKPTVYFICLFAAGFLLGVLFSLIVEITTRIGYERISVASAYVAVAGGFSDVLTPIITGLIVGMFGIASIYRYVLISIIITTALAIIVRIYTYESGGTYVNSK